MTKVINLYGGPGTGKSTTAARLFSIFKYNDINVELVREFAKDVVWEGTTKILDDSLFVIANQNRRIGILQGQVEYIITDSPIIMASVYNKEWEEVAKKAHSLYNNIEVFLYRDKKYQPAGRLQTYEESKQLDEDIKHLVTFDLSKRVSPQAADELFNDIIKRR